MIEMQMLCVPRGGDVKAAIEAFMLEKGWEKAFIHGAVGSVCNVLFTAPCDDSFPPVVERTPCAGPAEVVSFTGEVMDKSLMDPALREIYRDGGPLFIHIHASVATAGAHVYGGGFQQGTAFRALNIYLSRL